MSAPKKRQAYGKLSVQLRTHSRATIAEQICPGAMGLYAFLVIQARGEQSWGDTVEGCAHASWGAPIAYRRRQAKALIEAGLVELRDGRYWIVKYAEHNDTPEVIEANKAKDRARKRGSSPPSVLPDSERKPPGNHPGFPSSYSSSSSVDQDPEIQEVSDPDRGGEGPGEGGSQAKYAEAYAAGIRRGKCGAWAWPNTKYAAWDLGKIIAEHAKDPGGKPYRGDQLLRCIETLAAQFAGDVIARKKAQFYNAFEPRGCLRWLNEVDQTEEARRVG